MNIANLNKNNTMMSYKQLSFILTILLLLFTFSFACSPAVNPTDNNDEKTVFTPSLHIKVSDGSTDITDSLSIELDENDSTKIIISGLVNTIGAEDKTYTLTITPHADIFSIDGNDITITITEPRGVSPEDGALSHPSFTITNVNDESKQIDYTLIVPFSGAPVQDWLTSDTLSTYIEADFASQEAILTLSEYALSVIGLYNADNGTGSIKFDLPRGFEAIPESITLPDPDGAAITAATIIPSSATFTIRESDNIENSQEYTIKPITLAAVTVFTPGVHISISDSSVPVTGLSIEVDENESTRIIISGLVNSIGSDKTYTLTINPVTGVFSTPEDSTITIPITEPTGFSPGPGVLTPSNSFTITNDIGSSEIPYTVEVQFSGAPVEDWFNTDYISATFASLEASLILDGYNLSVNGLTNVDTGEGTISFVLPPGFVAVPESIPLTDPDDAGTGQNTITLDPNTFTISETGNADNNSQQYTVNPIRLSSLTVFTPGEHIVITDDTSSDTVSDLAFRVDENDSNKIIISGRGLRNALTEKTYTLTIAPVQGVFSTPGNDPIIINFADPTGFSPGPGVLTPSNSFTITNDIGSSEIPYTVEVQFSGAPVVDWLTDETTFSTYFTGATYAGQTLDSGKLSFNFDENSITIDGSSNLNYVPGAVPQLTTMDNIPSGYMLTQNLSAPDGSGLDAITNVNVGTITIAEENNPDDNTKDYAVTISLGAYASPVMASHISVTGFDDSPIVIEPNDIQIEQNIITISALANGTSGTGTVTITQPATEEYTVEPDSLSFDDPDGTDMEEFTVGTVDIESAGFTVSHTVKLNLKAYESPVEASHVTATFNSIPADPSNIVISGTNIIISGFFNIAGSTGSGSVTITQPDTGEFTVENNSRTFDFTDPPGFDSQDKEVGTVSVTSAGVIASHTIIISFSAPISLKINSDKVPSDTVTILKGGTVTLEGLNACELLTQPTFEVDGSTVTVTGFPSYFDRRFDRRIDSSSGSTYTVNSDLILEDANGVVLDETYTVQIAGFPACDATHLTGSGADADPYEIDSAPKLELLSHLVNSGNINYSLNKYYKLTNNIDLGLAGLPWSEEASGETGEGFPSIGIGTSTFGSTFDCDDNSISNLYININRTDVQALGLFGYGNGANIQNCSLINVNVTGFNRVGGLAGFINLSTITNSYVTSGSVTGRFNVGGLVGSQNQSTITNSYAYDDVQVVVE